MLLNEKLVILRKAKRISRAELASKINVSQEDITAYEAGEKTPPIDKLIDLATILGVSADTLLREDVYLQGIQNNLSIKENNTMSNQNTDTTLNRDFVAYEYQTIEARTDNAALYKDCYQNFGWQKIEEHASVLGFGTVTLKFKRDRRIKNRAELNDLQRQTENALAEIDRLERGKSQSAMIASMSVGMAGTVAMAVATFGYIYANSLPLMIPFGVVGLALWAIPYFIYKKIKAKKTVSNSQKIDEQYETVYKLNEQANALSAQA
jgi:transcriptional regulator with XRE-family HTH domain